MPLSIQPDTTRLSKLTIRGLRWLTAVALSVAVFVAAVGTIHWPIVGDAPLFHYIAFLIDHGKVPYRDIADINMPGTYALEWFAIHALGPGPLAWRFFDCGLVAACAAAMVVIAWPIDWLAGFFGGAMFALIHFRDGPTHTGQRDLMMTTMVLLACASVFATARSRRAGTRACLAVVFGLFAGMAAIVKPSGVLFVAALFAMLLMRRESEAPDAPTLATMNPSRRGVTLICAATGFLVPVLLCVVWLIRHDALAAFIANTRGLAAYHASLGRPSMAALIVGSFPSVLLAVVLPSLPLFAVEKSWRRLGGITLLACAVIGAVSYVLQGKGFPYHRYPTEAFLLLGCGLLLFPALRQTGWPRWVAVAGLLLGVLYLAPASAAIAVRYDWRNQEFNNALASDFARLGGNALQNQIQCLDMTAGCTNTLYNMQLVQATGFMYDCYLFQPKQTPVSLKYREDFWQAFQAARPNVLVISDQQCFAMTRNWQQPDRWPQFAEMLARDYTLDRQYTPPHMVAWWRKPAVPYSYRLYVRKGDPPSQPK